MGLSDFETWGAGAPLLVVFEAGGPAFGLFLTALHGRIIPLLWVYMELRYLVLGDPSLALFKGGFLV